MVLHKFGLGVILSGRLTQPTLMPTLSRTSTIQAEFAVVVYMYPYLIHAALFLHVSLFYAVNYNNLRSSFHA